MIISFNNNISYNTKIYISEIFEMLFSPGKETLWVFDCLCVCLLAFKIS